MVGVYSGQLFPDVGQSQFLQHPLGHIMFWLVVMFTIQLKWHTNEQNDTLLHKRYLKFQYVVNVFWPSLPLAYNLQIQPAEQGQRDISQSPHYSRVCPPRYPYAAASSTGVASVCAYETGNKNDINVTHSRLVAPCVIKFYSEPGTKDKYCSTTLNFQDIFLGISSEQNPTLFLQGILGNGVEYLSKPP